MLIILKQFMQRTILLDQETCKLTMKTIAIVHQHLYVN